MYSSPVTRTALMGSDDSSYVSEIELFVDGGMAQVSRSEGSLRVRIEAWRNAGSSRTRLTAGRYVRP
jgi:hypothetical protein